MYVCTQREREVKQQTRELEEQVTASEVECYSPYRIEEGQVTSIYNVHVFVLCCFEVRNHRMQTVVIQKGTPCNVRHLKL